jgi:hypothetical protein
VRGVRARAGAARTPPAVGARYSRRKTEREREVVALGQGNDEIAGALVLGPTTSQRMDGAGSAWGPSSTSAFRPAANALSAFEPGGRLRSSRARTRPYAA